MTPIGCPYTSSNSQNTTPYDPLGYQYTWCNNYSYSYIFIFILGWRENKRYQLPGEDNIDPKQKEAQILNVMKQKYNNLGPLKCHELSVLICFIVVICLWFFRKPLFMFGKFAYSPNIVEFYRRIIGLQLSEILWAFLGMICIF